jgi:glycosyltransferase involved in cell wall biosynthesis
MTLPRPARADRSIEPPAILHIEAGPTFGGSTLALQNYLEHADPALFRHDALFFCDVPGCEAIRAHSRRFLCLHRPAPAGWDRAPAPATPATQTARTPAWRRFAKRVPGARGLARSLRDWSEFLAQGLPLALRLARMLRRGRYDLVHCNNTFVVQRATLLAAWLTHTPAVAHARTRVTLRPIDRLLGNRTRRIAAVSVSLADDLYRQGLRRPIEVCYEGTRIGPVAQATPDARRELGGDGGPVLGFAGRLVERKGVIFLLKAMPAILARHPGARLVLAGDGPLQPALEDHCRRHDLSGAVRFLGFRRDVPALLAAIDLFALPSLTEGLPLVLLEAMAAARPIVACAVDGVPEFVRHAETGLLVPPASAPALAEAILQLLDDPARAAALGRAGRAFVEARGDVRVTARAFDAALRDALRR